MEAGRTQSWEVVLFPVQASKQGRKPGILEDSGSPRDPRILRDLGILGETRIPVAHRRLCTVEKEYLKDNWLCSGWLHHPLATLCPKTESLHVLLAQWQSEGCGVSILEQNKPI